MFNKIQLQNFKSINNELPLELSNCTILCGANSSGKSSLIQSILMINQTITSIYNNNKILLNSYLTRLGTFEDIKSSFTDDNNIVIEFDITPDKSTKLSPYNLPISYHNICIKLRFSSDHNGDLHPPIYEIDIHAHSTHGNTQQISLTKQEKENLYSIKDEQVFLEKVQKEYPEAKILGCQTQGFLPDKIIIEYNYRQFMAKQLLAYFIGEKGNNNLAPKCIHYILMQVDDLIEQSHNEFNTNLSNDIKQIKKEFKEVLSDLTEEDQNNIATMFLRKRLLKRLPKKLIAPSKHGENPSWSRYLQSLNNKDRDSLTDLIKKNENLLIQNYCRDKIDLQETARIDYPIRDFREINQSILSYFKNSIKYLGPLRNDPQPIYPSLGLLDPMDIGLKGEYSAAVLHINNNKFIEYPVFASTSEQQNILRKKGSLREACIYWLHYLGVAQNIQTKDHGKLGYGVTVQSSSHGKWQDLTHVGVGVSQVLPIILMSLLSTENDVLIFEQPELHLHPKVQSLLGDFFLALIEWKRQCIIESHSEYIINKLRYRIVQNTENKLQDKIAIYFIEKNDQDRSIFKKIKINQYGAIHDWPKDFFDQSDNDVEAILIAATNKKFKEKNNLL